MEKNQDPIFDLARLFTETRYEDLSPKAVETAKKLFIDIMATATAGSTAAIVPEVAKYFTDLGGRPEASILVYGDKIPAPNAAQVNALMAHSRDWDDTLEDAVIHETVSLIPAALAIAERDGGISGKEFIKAIVVGCDVMSRLCYGTPMSTTDSGWRFTSLMSYFGSAMTASYLSGQTVEQIANAAGIVLSQAGGILQVVKDSALTKRMEHSFGTHDGVQAADLTSIGVVGCKNVIEGAKGFYQVYFSGEYDREALLKDLGTFWHIENLSFKPYPCCRYTHCNIDAAKRLVAEHGITPEEIISIDAATSEQGYGCVCFPEEVRKAPKSVVDAQFSIPFTASTVIVKGTVGLDAFEPEGLTDPIVLDLCSKFNLSVDSEIEEKFHDGCPPTRLTIHTTRGDFSDVVWHASGSIENMVSMEDIIQKYYSTKPFSAYPVKDGSMEKVVNLALHMEELDDMNALISAVNDVFER